MERVSFTIDGKRVTGYKGQTVLQVARENGIYIPALCYDEEVRPYSACRMCLVHVKKGKRERLVTSCDYPVSEGIEVTTDSDVIRKCRKVVLQLLMARCPNLPKLKQMAAEFGVEEQPRFVKSNDDCILCGLCVRVCEDVVGVYAIGFEGRGFTRRVCTPFDEESPNCIVCGACSYVCPVDVIPIEEKDGYRIMERWHKKSRLIPCPKCGSYYLTEDQLKFLKEKTGLPEEELSICPSCR